MGQRQLEFWDNVTPQENGRLTVTQLSQETSEGVTTLIQNEECYVSLKRVSLVHEGTVQHRPSLASVAEAKRFFAQYWHDYPGNDQERFVVACLETKHRVQSVSVISIGTLDASLVHPREVFKPAIIEGSSAIILSHNHPSGDTTPSKEDRAVTKRLTDAGDLLGIEVLDHIIHGDGTNELLSIREA